MDDIAIHDINTGLFAYPAILVGFRLGLFEFVGTQARTPAEISAELKITPRVADALVTLAAALKFLEREGDGYVASEMTRQYVLRGSPTSWAGYLDMLTQNSAMYSYETIDISLRSGRPRLYDERDTFDANRQEPGKARDYARWIHSVSKGPADAWPRIFPLSQRRMMLDIAGGTGVHSIAAAKAFPELRCEVLDLENTVAIAREFIAEEGLSERVTARACDMWKDPFPPADVHFYSQIFHDWSTEECEQLARKSFDALPPGGALVVHELLMNDERSGPIPAVVVNLMMCLLYGSGRQFSGKEIEDILVKAGFVSVRRDHTFGHWHLISGVKPS